MSIKRIEYILLQTFSFGDNSVSKIVTAALSIVAGFIGPIWPFLAVAFALSGADLYTGWRKSRKLTGSPMTSKGIGGTIEKIVLYSLAILLAEGVRRVFGLDDIWGLNKMTYVVAGLIAWRELLSNFENISAIVGWDLVGRFRELVTSVFNKKG